MSILFPQQSQDYTLMSGKTNFKSGKAGQQIKTKRVVVVGEATVGNTFTGWGGSPLDSSDIYGGNYLLQPFTTGDLVYTLNDIEVQIKRVGTAVIQTQLYLLDANLNPTGSALFTGLLDSIDTSYSLITLGSPPSTSSKIFLQPNTTYGILFRVLNDGGDASNKAIIGWEDSALLYGSHLGSTNSGSTWTEDTTKELHITIYFNTYEVGAYYYGQDVAENMTRYLGFSTSSVDRNSNITVQTEGIITGLKDSSGADLVNGTNYYVTTDGAIRTTTGNGFLAGRAIDIDKLLIIRDI